MKQLELCPICQGALTERGAVQPNPNQSPRYARCPGCGLLVMNPFPDQKEIAAFYSDQSYGLGPTKFPVWLEWFRDHSQDRRSAWVQSRSVAAVGSWVLDVGCGSGAFLKAMSARGYKIFGTELAGPAAERAKAIPGLELLLGEVGEDNLPANSFEAITLWHVLEHMPAPAGTLQRCRQLLRTSGQLFLEVPNLSSWQARVFGRHWLHLDPPRHLFQFTPQALELLLEEAGFQCVERSTFSLSMGWLGALQSGLNALMKPRDLFYRLLLTRGRLEVSGLAKLMAVLGALIASPLALLFCLAETCVGRGAVLRYRCRPTNAEFVGDSR